MVICIYVCVCSGDGSGGGFARKFKSTLLCSEITTVAAELAIWPQIELIEK